MYKTFFGLKQFHNLIHSLDTADNAETISVVRTNWFFLLRNSHIEYRSAQTNAVLQEADLRTYLAPETSGLHGL